MKRIFLIIILIMVMTSTISCSGRWRTLVRVEKSGLYNLSIQYQDSEEARAIKILDYNPLSKGELIWMEPIPTDTNKKTWENLCLIRSDDIMINFAESDIIGYQLNAISDDDECRYKVEQ